LAVRPDIGIQYDSAKGTLTKMTGPGTALSYAYEGNRVTKETFQSYSASFEIGYNGAGLRSSLKLPVSGQTYGYAYDSKGRLTRVYCGSYSLATFVYDSSTDRLMTRTSYDINNGLKHLAASYAYDAVGRLTRVGNQGYDSGGSEADSCAIGYLFNAAGSVTKCVLDDDPGQWLAYQYDPLDRLTREERSGTGFDYLNEYWYDAAGNRTKLAYTHDGSTETTAYLYDDNYRLTQSSTDGTDTTYEWNGAGDLTKRATDGGDTWEYQWDARDMMTKVRKQPNGGSMTDVASYAYDPRGRRCLKTRGWDTQYFQDGLTPVVERQQIGQGITTVNHSVPGAQGNVIQTYSVSIDQFYAYDRLGNVLATFDTDGAKIVPVMDAFGKVLDGATSGFHYTTRQYDEDVEFFYFYARWYSPQLGRFVMKCPLPRMFEHPYAVVEGRPTTDSDVTGLCYSGYLGYDPWMLAGCGTPDPPNPYWPPGVPPFPGNNNANKCFAWMACNSFRNQTPAMGCCILLECGKEVVKIIWDLIDIFIPGDHDIFGGWERGDIRDFCRACEEWGAAKDWRF